MQLEQYNYETYRLIVETWPWATVSTTLHMVLGHSAEVIARDGGRGLGWKSEQGGEAINDPLRQIKAQGARSHDEETACRDTFNKLFLQSHPEFRAARPVVRCKGDNGCGAVGHSIRNFNLSDLYYIS